jgi:hypothetical protein
MKKLLYIAPHLSTGGLPQYLAKKIELLNDVYDIYAIEYEDFTGGVLVVQKNKIKDLLGDKLMTIAWGGDKQRVIDFINQVNPDIIHLEEMPEYFMVDDVAKQIYKSDRKYKIFETSHDSSFNTQNKRFVPDKFILVSNYQVGMLSDLSIPSEVVEYPIEYKERPNREEALKSLGLDPEYKHVLHVGLFTPRKNQAEFFEYARMFENEKVIFHSVGNLADNFKNYWEPLMEKKPKNLIAHGERSDVDNFYSSMDLFLFTSRGTINDKETMPLVIREAISWNIPTLIYNLPVYQNYFDSFEGVNYLEFDNFENNVNIISDKLSLSKKDSIESKTAIVISTYPNSKHVIDLTTKAINEVKKHGCDVILSSHYPIPSDLQKLADYIVYDSNNLLVYHDYYSTAWQTSDSIEMLMNIKTENNHLYHGPAVYTNYYNGISMAKMLGYDNAICFNYDMIINDENVINFMKNELNLKKAVYNTYQAMEGNCFRTVIFATNTKFFVDNFNLIKTPEDYTNWKESIGSESNGLENIFYHNLKNKINDIRLLTNDEYDSLLSNCETDLCSMVEYFNILPIKDTPEVFGIWYSTSNVEDNRDVKIVVEKNDRILNEFPLTIKTSQYWYRIYVFNHNDLYKVSLYQDGTLKKSILIDNDYFNNKLKINGLLTIK